MNLRVHVFTVTVQVAATQTDAKEYVYNAVRSYGGAFPPDDPFFGDNKIVTVTPVRKPK